MKQDNEKLVRAAQALLDVWKEVKNAAGVDRRFIDAIQELRDSLPEKD